MGAIIMENSEFESVIASYSAEIQQLARLSRDLIYTVLPETVEVVWQKQKTVGYGTGAKKMTEQFSWLAPASKHITFGFYYGAELPDPEQLLEGSGKLLRHVKIRSEQDLAKAALRELLEHAIHHRVPPPKSKTSE
jgi:hypothetical protein